MEDVQENGLEGLRAHLTQDGTQKLDVLISMKKEDNTWKIDSFDLADFSLQDASQSAQDKES